MVTSAKLYLGFLGLLYAERGAELLLSRRNARLALASGGVESGRDHYPLMVGVHALFPLACALEVLLLHRRFPGVVGAVALALALGAQALRWWVVATLGRRWNTRVIAVPGERPVTGGPYRYVRHPNYLAVVLEALAVPLIHGAWISAVVFVVANVALLSVRVPVEERALGKTYSAVFERLPRFLPGGRRA